MKISFTQKAKPQPKILKNQPSGTVFGLYNEMDFNQEDRDYYIIITRNGHREYYNLADGSFRPLNDDCPIMVMDCALTIYGIRD
jgi:hypothetical protein